MRSEDVRDLVIEYAKATGQDSPEVLQAYIAGMVKGYGMMLAYCQGEVAIMRAMK